MTLQTLEFRLFFSIFLFATGCAADTAFLVGRDVPVESDRIEKVYDLFYLLETDDRDEPTAYSPKESFLKGDWQTAASFWASSPNPDCRTMNNIGLSVMMLGELTSARSEISKALATCPEDEKIQWNWRMVQRREKTPSPPPEINLREGKVRSEDREEGK